MLTGKKILIVVSGSVAAFKVLTLIRLLRKDGAQVKAVLTAGGAQFVTAHALQAITGQAVAQDLFSLEEEQAVGHIRLARWADLVVVAPASASMIARMALGLADDLAGAVLLACDRPVLLAPAMNPMMWQHPATQGHIRTLAARGVTLAGPDDGPMAEPESGPGRLIEPEALLDAIRAQLQPSGPLAGKHALVTSGPTHEPIDPVRYIANRSSGRQGHAIAAALAALGARVTLISGPVGEADPRGVQVVRIETAAQMLDACRTALPADIAVCAAAVADWRPAHATSQKMKKVPGSAPAPLELVQNPDILATLSAAGPARPKLVVGFAAETETVLEHAAEKRRRKGCDWIVANDVSGDVMGGARNTVHLISETGTEHWPELPKEDVARRLAARIAAFF